jgi:hypothetical protein
MTVVSPMAYVYDGRRCLGFILARGKLGFEAMDRDEQSLGLFLSQRAAADALTAKDKGPENSLPGPISLAGEPA